MPAETRSDGATAGRRPRVFSGIQPSGDVHLGNYLGAIQRWAAEQGDKENYFCVVDLQPLTVPQDPGAAPTTDPFPGRHAPGGRARSWPVHAFPPEPRQRPRRGVLAPQLRDPRAGSTG